MGVPDAIGGLLAQFGIGKSVSIVDVGCGRGHSTHAPNKRGFKNLTAMDPNSRYSTGTKYRATPLWRLAPVSAEIDRFPRILRFLMCLRVCVGVAMHLIFSLYGRNRY